MQLRRVGKKHLPAMSPKSCGTFRFLIPSLRAARILGAAFLDRGVGVALEVG